jgi:hypothetical protein
MPCFETTSENSEGGGGKDKMYDKIQSQHHQKYGLGVSTR